MPNCEELITIDAFVSSNLLRVFESQRQPMKMLEISDFSSFLSRIHSEPALKRSLEGLSKVYREADSSGYKIEPDRFGGFGLYNRTGKILKPKLEPLGDVVGILEDIPPELKLRLKPLSIMKSSSSDKDVVLLGVVRFVNHSCLANTRFFQGYSCQYLKNRNLRLQFTRTIYPDEEITADYGDSFFSSVGECKCDVCSIESELPMYREQIENTAERSVECFLDTDNLQQESEQIVGSDIKSVLVSTEEKLLPALTTADETNDQTSELNEGFDEKFSDAHLFGTFGNERKACKRKKFPKHRTPSKVKKRTTFGCDIIDSYISHAHRSLEGDDMHRSSTPSSESETSGLLSDDDGNFVSNVENFGNVSDDSEESRNSSDSILSAQETEEAASQTSLLKFSRESVCECSDVTVHNSFLSLLSIVTNYGCPDEVLYDLIKRENIINPNKLFPTPYAAKKLIPDLTKSYVQSHEAFNNGELICIRFFNQLRCIINRNIQNIFQYSNKRDPTKDIKVKRLVKGNNLRVRLILNTDGAIVRNSASESAYPV